MRCGVCNSARTQEDEIGGTRTKRLDGFCPEGARFDVRAFIVTPIIRAP
jgi:hypothetical protein